MAAARYIVVAEDAASARFIEQHLIKSCGVSYHEIRTVPVPPRGSAKQWVTQRYPVEVRAFRSKNAHGGRCWLS